MHLQLTGISMKYITHEILRALVGNPSDFCTVANFCANFCANFYANFSAFSQDLELPVLIVIASSSSRLNSRACLASLSLSSVVIWYVGQVQTNPHLSSSPCLWLFVRSVPSL